MGQAERIVARYVAAKKMPDEEYRQTPQYKAGPPNKDYYPQVAPKGLAVPSEVNKLPPLLRKWFDAMPEKDLDSNRGGYTNPGFKAAYKEILGLLLKGAVDKDDLLDQYKLVEKLKFDVFDKYRAAKTDEEGDPYRFAARKLNALWRVYNGLFQSDDFKKIEEKHEKLRRKRDLPINAKPTTNETPRGKRITTADIPGIEDRARVRFVIGEGDDMFVIEGFVQSKTDDTLYASTSGRTVWTFSDAPGVSHAMPLSRIALI